MKHHRHNLIYLYIWILSLFFACSSNDDDGNTQTGAPEINAQSFTVAEDIADNMPIGTVQATDPEGDTLTYSITQNDNNIFEISNTGVLSLEDLQTLDFETTQSHTITVSVSDGTTTAEATITINVTDIDDTSFVTTWETTTGTGDEETVIIPTRSSEYTYNYTIDWGDGTTQTGRTGDVTHSYTTPGIHTIRISGDFPAIHMLQVNGLSLGQLRSVEQWGSIKWKTMFNAFADVNRLTINAADAPDLSLVNDLAAMFFACDILTGNFNHWDVSHITDMSAMFGASSFNQDISSWDVSNVTNMSEMFSISSFNQDISGWDVSSVNDMSRMFERSLFNQDISPWDMNNVTDMRGMFSGSSFNQDISTWDVSNVTDMARMFQDSSFNQDISGWDVSNVINMNFMFANSSFNQDISGWDVSNVTDMARMFQDSSFNQDISGWDVSNVTNMTLMFANSSFNQDISNWDVGNVTNCAGFASQSPLTANNTPNFTNCTP